MSVSNKLLGDSVGGLWNMFFIAKIELIPEAV